MKKISTLLCCVSIHLLLLLPSNKSFAWGPEGHAIVARIAMHFVKDDVRQNILSILGDMSIDTAANWMDMMKSNPNYDFMRPWHYIDFPKEQRYQPSTNDNILNRLLITFNELKHKNTLCSDQIKIDLLVLLHLMGDLHMPLHTAYEDDLGGNQRVIHYDTMKTHNLHRFWDEDIIRLGNITMEDCLRLYKQYPSGKIDTIQGLDFVRWMNESRSLLDRVYAFKGFTIDQEYLDKNKLVVERQLLIAGIRLASILDKLFYTPPPIIDTKAVTAKYRNGIEIYDAMKYIGKNITVCARVFGIHSTDKITQINLEAAYPNSPLTVVIFAKSYLNFKPNPDELYKDKNVCVQGKITEYKGKPQIIVEQPNDITIL